MIKIGDTLSQRALAIRFSLDRETVRNRGETIRGSFSAPGITWRETWARITHGSGRVHGYRLIEIRR